MVLLTTLESALWLPAFVTAATAKYQVPLARFDTV
jgi:hypothetical protein